MVLRFAAFIFLVNGISCGVCPPSEVIYPCKCTVNSVISCSSGSLNELKNIFKSLSGNLRNDDKIFNQFILENSQITEIDDGFFQDIMFQGIRLINTPQLKRIHPNAFKSIAGEIQAIENEGIKSIKSKQNIFIHLYHSTSFNIIPFPKKKE